MGSNRKDRNGGGKGEEKEGKESAGAATYAASSNIVCSFLFNYNHVKNPK